MQTVDMKEHSGAGVADGPPPAWWGWLLVACGAWALVAVRAALGRGAPPRADEVWMGGVPAANGAPPIHPHGFYSPVRETLARAYVAPRWRSPGRPAWLPPAVDLDRWAYRPAAAAGRRLAGWLRRLHTGAPDLYIAWQLAGAAALALLLLLLRRGGAR